MRKILFLYIVLAFLSIGNAVAQDFGRYFTDATLRLDYIFAGSDKEQAIYLDCLSTSPRWYGKRQRLTELPVEGNGQIIVRDHKSQLVIYRNSFSTLFQEWQTYDEAAGQQRSFENVFLVPMPKDTVDVTVLLRDNRRQVKSEMTHQVVPDDILIRRIGYDKVTPYEQILTAKNPSRSINIAIVAEGYTEEEMDIFLDDCNVAMDALFAHEPFKANKDRFNIIAVKSPSCDSGTSEPANGMWKNTALSSHFNTFYQDRYLTTLHLKDLHDILAGTPYEHIIVLVNTEKYGGGGILNFYTLVAGHSAKMRPVVVHEFGHSFAGLGDEYHYDDEEMSMYPLDIEPWEANITTMVDFDSKWKDMIGTDGVDLIEGAGYCARGIYRSADDCRMRTNECPQFCRVCQCALARVIDFYTE